MKDDIQIKKFSFMVFKRNRLRRIDYTKDGVTTLQKITIKRDPCIEEQTSYRALGVRPLKLSGELALEVSLGFDLAA